MLSSTSRGLCLLSATRNGFAASNLFQLLGQVYNCQISSKFTRNDRPEVEQTDLGLAELRTTARRHPDGPNMAAEVKLRHAELLEAG